MCGFVAIIGPGAPLPDAVLTHMRDQLAHRGPDGAANWQSMHANGTVAFGFRRLAIIDIRHVADQPMSTPDGHYVIMLNGEIYNYIELREELIVRGHRFQTRSDTEVVLRAYIEWGEAMVHRLNGMFAFVIWDAERGEAFIGRDRFGEKPLYYTRLPDGKLAFASEMKALLAHPDMRISYDIKVMSNVMEGQIIFGKEETLFEGITQFKASHTMRVGMDGRICDYTRYWKPTYDRTLGKLPREELTAMLRAHLERSVKLRMRSDVPVTACLSGGLDSSALVTLLARQKGIDAAISVRFPTDPTIDEGTYIHQILDASRLKGHTVTPTSDELMRDLRKLHWHHETVIPGLSMYLEWALMRDARALGYKVILDGQGADEVFAGYANYLKAHQTEMANQSLGGVIKALRLGRQRHARLRNAAKLYIDASRRFSQNDGLPFNELFTHLQTYALLQNTYGGDAMQTPTSIGALRYELAIHLLHISLPSNLYSGDRNSMAHGIECRYPFLDYELVDFATHLPDWAYLEKGWGKAIVRHAMDDVMPESVTWRADKVGFSAPQDAWLKAPAMKHWVEERIFDSVLQSVPEYRARMLRNAWEAHQSGAVDHSALLWKWASVCELLDMQRSGAWGKSPVLLPVANKKTAWIISYTPVCKEPRVIRQAEALIKAGWRVVVFGLKNTMDVPKDWHFVPLPDNLPKEDCEVWQALFSKRIGSIVCSFYVHFQRILRAVSMVVARLGVFPQLKLLGARCFQRLQLPFHWKRRVISHYWSDEPALRPQLVLCHDYFTADIGLMIAHYSKASIVVDCHEYACGQYVHIPGWTKWHRPYVAALQDFYLKQADAVTVICEGIGDLIKKDHALECPVHVVRSTPFYEAQSFRPTGETITVLYHGEIFASRGIHVAIRSMQYWRPEFRILLRGNADVGYLDELKAIAKEVGVEDRLTIEPAVPFADIISAANKADIGYFVHEDLSAQRRFTLPNKFFEYMMAGLALCVSDLPEMARLVKQYEAGQLVNNCDPKAIADIMNRFDRPMIDRMKKHSLEAAKTLNWEIEKQHMLTLYESICA